MKQYLSVREAVLDLFGAEKSYVQPVSGGDINWQPCILQIREMYSTQGSLDIIKTTI